MTSSDITCARADTRLRVYLRAERVERKQKLGHLRAQQRLKGVGQHTSPQCHHVLQLVDVRERRTALDFDSRNGVISKIFASNESPRTFHN